MPPASSTALHADISEVWVVAVYPVGFVADLQGWLYCIAADNGSSNGRNVIAMSGPVKRSFGCESCTFIEVSSPS